MINKILRSEYFYAVLISILTTLVFFWGNLFGDAYFWEDVAEYVFPTQFFAATSDGIPFWNPYTFGGMPFFADLQVGFLYPLNRLLDLFVSNDQLPYTAVQLVIILHFIIAQINCFYLAKKWNMSFWAAFIAAFSFSFSLLMICHVIHPMMIYHLAWLPLIIAFLYRAFNESKVYLSIIAGLIFGFSMLSGHPQTLLYELIFIGIFSLYYLIISFKSDIKPLKVVLSLVLTFAIAYGIFTVQYLPSQELADLSQRAEIDYEKSTEGSLYFGQVLSTVVPNIFGTVSGDDLRNSTFYLKFAGTQGIHYYWETAFYFGVIAVAFGLFAIISSWKRRKNLILIILALFGFFFALGSNFFFYDIFYNLPFVGTFRNPARILFFTIFAFSFLAGFGFDNLKSNIKNLNRSLIIAFSIPILLAILVLTGFFFDNLDTPAQLQDDIESRAFLSIFFLVVVFVLSYFTLKNKLNLKITGSIVLLLIFIDLYSTGEGFNKNPNNPEEQQVPRGYKLPVEFKNAFTPDLPDEIFRVNMRMYQPQRYMAFKRNQGMTDRIMLLEGYNPLILERVNPPMPNDQLNLDIRNVRYSIGIDRSINAPRFYENRDRFGNAWFVNKVKYVNENNIKEVMESGEIDFQKTVVLEDEIGFESIDTEPEVDIKCIKYKNNQIVYEISNSTEGLLVLSEIFYPAWKAEVNDKRTEIHRANYCFRSIKLNAGENRIVLEYDSAEFNIGRNIFIITILISIIGIFILRKYDF